MTLTPPEVFSYTLDEPAYDWLENQTALLGELDPDKNSGLYAEALQKMISEGSEKLAHSDKEDPVLFCNLQRLLAEARLDLALVEAQADDRDTLLYESFQHCAVVISTLQTQKIYGLTCTLLPRTLAILGYVFYNIAPEKNSLLYAAQKEAIDLLESSLAQQQLDREKAADLMAAGRFLVHSLNDISNPADRRVVLEQALDNFRQAAYLAGGAFDFDLNGQAQKCQTAVEAALSSPGLSTPSLPLPAHMTGDPLEPIDRYLAAQAIPAPVSLPAAEAVCRKCGSPLKTGKNYCGVCGAPVKASLTPAAGNRTCPKCGYGLKPGVKFCGHCGNKL